MPRSAACGGSSATGATASAGGVWSLYSTVRTAPPPNHGKPKFSPGLVAWFNSPGGLSSPMPSTWLSVNQRVLSVLKSIPTELRIPVAKTSRFLPSASMRMMPPIPSFRYRSILSAGGTL